MAATKESKKGRIEAIIGPMYAGKSGELMRRLRRHNIAKDKCFLVKHKNDLRYSDESVMLSSYDRVTMPATPASAMEEVDLLVADVDVIGVDEGQFYPDLVEYAEQWAAQGKIVIVSALSGDFKRDPFPVISALLPKCENISFLTSICFKCHGEAHYSMRLIVLNGVTNVGGKGTYEAACRDCHQVVSKE